MNRIVLLVDLDYFYAQVEILRHPEFKGKPVVVCVYSGRTKTSGAIGAANYEARALGIRSGMMISQAQKRATKETVFLPTDLMYYREVSERIMSILRTHVDVMEQVSIDEAYGDITQKSKGSYKKAEQIAKKLKADLLKKEHLTCSVGIGPNKLVAKMAVSVNKPDGITIMRPTRVRRFLNPLPVKKLHSIGPKTEERLAQVGVKTIKDLSLLPLEKLQELFGEKKGLQLFSYSKGKDDSLVEERGEKEQVSRIGTLKKDSNDLTVIDKYIDFLCDDLEKRLKNRDAFKSVTFIAITTHLQTHTKSTTLQKPTKNPTTIKKEAKLLAREFLKEHPKAMLRRAGVKVSGFLDTKAEQEKTQKTLFEYNNSFKR